MRPTLGMVGALIGWALFGVLALVNMVPLVAFFAAGGVLMVLALQDIFFLRQLPTPSIERDLPQVVPVGVKRTISLRLHHTGQRSLNLAIHDLHPGDWTVFGLPRRATLTPGRELTLPYELTPAERGTFQFEGCSVRLFSPLRLWHQQRFVPILQTVRVYPNFSPLAKLALIGAEQASRVMGAHIKRRRGEGTEFQQLREYRTGDSLRQIDWKASRRALKLISRDYQDERNQQVMLLIDTGRRLLARDGALSHFDHVLNASLMVAYMALRQGDAIGLLASGGMARFMAPRRGLGAIDTLLNTVFDLNAQAIATDYLEAATQLTLRQSRRCLVLLITNVRDEDMQDLLAAVRQLQKRHLVCVASLREHILDELLEQNIHTFDDALRAAGMAQYLEYRTRAHQALRAQGTDVLDVTCQELPAALIQHYLAIKRAGRL